METMTVGDLRAAMAGLPDDTPVLLDEQMTGWVSTLPRCKARVSSWEGQRVLLFPSSSKYSSCVNADESGGPVELP